MTSQPRDVLIEIVAKLGEPLLASPGRCEGLLKDYCGEFRREIFVLVSCLRIGVVEQLRQQSGPAVKLACARLTLKLEQNLAISSDIAKWAVESWAIALGLLDPLAATGPIKNPRQPTGPLPVIQPAPSAAAASETIWIDEPPSGAAPETEAKPMETVAPEVEPGPEFLAREFESRWPVLDWAQPSGEILVYPDGSGEKPGLREAVRDAAENSCLLLQPGLYKESLVIKRTLQIRADGEPGEVVLESISSSTIILDGASLFLSGLMLKGIPGKDKKAASAIEVKSGHLVMEDCDLTSESSTIMEVKGARAEATLRRCQLHDGKAGGIIFQDEAVGYLEECHFFQNKLSHVAIGKGCAPTLFNCKISNALMAGIYVNEGGGGLIENCDIWGNAVAGVQCRRGGNPRVRFCRVSMNERYGVLVAEQGEGLFEDCQIFDNTRAGVTVGQQSKPRFSACQIFDNHGEGIEIVEQSRGEYVECDIFSNEGANIAVKDKSAPMIYHCQIHDGRQEGLRISMGSEGLYEQCDIFSNTMAGALVTQNAKPVFQTTRFFNGSESGVTLLHGADAQFLTCQMTNHGGPAVVVSQRAIGRFDRCDISKNVGIGVHVDEASTPTFQDCTINENGGVGFSCAQSGSPRVVDGEINQNNGGLLVSTQGKGRWDNVQFISNRGDGVSITDGGRPMLRKCHIDMTEGAGVRFRTTGGGSLDDVSIVESGGSGIEIEGGASPTLRQVRVIRGRQAGIVVHALGSGTADKCEVRDNVGGDWQLADNARLNRIGC